MAASVASMAGRSTIIRTLCRASVPRRPSLAVPPRPSSFGLRRTPIAHPSPLRLVRRELSSFQPLHSAIASAYLVSKLPCEGSTSSEGRFANYISPI